MIYQRLLFSCFLVIGIGNLPHFHLCAQNYNLIISQSATGGFKDPLNTVGQTIEGNNICPVDPSPGCDFSNTDTLVRNNDVVTYNFAYNLTGGADTNITVRATLPIGYVWDYLPGFCTGVGSIITGTGAVGSASSIVCNIGNKTAGTAQDLPFGVRVRGDVPNGSSFTFSGEIKGDSNNSATANAPTIYTTGTPRYNLKKQIYDVTPVSISGTLYFRINYMVRIGAYKVPASGMEALVTPITFVDDLSLISPNAILETCVQNSVYFYPTYTLSNISQSLSNTGSIACNQVGTNVNVSITGIDTSLWHYPTLTKQNTSVGTDWRYAGEFFVRVLVPTQDVINAGGTLNTTNTYTTFDPVSITGQSNFGTQTEPLSDNTADRTLIATNGSWSKILKDGVGHDSNWVGTETTSWGGQGLIGADQYFVSRLAVRNDGVSDLTNVTICDIIDTNTTVLATLPSGTTSTLDQTTRWQNYLSVASLPPVVEYAAGYIGTWPPSGANATAVRTECNDPSIVWTNDPSTLGGLANVTKYRIRFPNPMPAASGVLTFTQLKTKAGLANGTIIQNRATIKSDTWASGWASCNYNPGSLTVNHSATGCGDRAIISKAIVRIQKKTDSPLNPMAPDDLINASLPGGNVTYYLQPTTTAATDTVTPTDVTITDVLPVGMTFASATPPPTSILNDTPTAGKTTLTWFFSNTIPNVTMSPVILNATVNLNVPNNTTLTNTTVISSPDDPSIAAERTASRNILISAPAGVYVNKTVDKPIVNTNTNFTYTLEYFNASSTDLNNIQIIDILPYNGDVLTPPTNYTPTQSFVLQAPTLAAGITIEYTKATPSSINIDPKDSSNQSGGATIWCAALSGGTCPTSLSEVTALRFTDTVTFVKNTPPRTISFSVLPTNNHIDDVYSNNFGLAANETTLTVNSNVVTTTVVGLGLGGTLFSDVNNNGDFEPSLGETTFSNITVELYQIGANPAIDLPLKTTTSDGSGLYYFDKLEVGSYFVVIRKSNFPANVVSSYSGSAATVSNTDADNDDDGKDDGEFYADYIRTATIVLSAEGEPTNDGIVSTNTPDNNHNLTADFGFAPAASCAPTPVTVLVTQNSCTGLNANSDASIALASYTSDHLYQYVASTTFNATTAIPSTPSLIPTSGIIESNIAPSLSNRSYLFRIYDQTVANCVADLPAQLNRISCGAELILEKTMMKNGNPVTQIYSGYQFDYVLTLRNTGMTTALDVSVRDILPVQLSFVSANPSQGTFNSNTGIWTVGDINALSSQTLIITVRTN
jgi:uncharacterized repeat protein (TIGR01451 family)